MMPRVDRLVIGSSALLMMLLVLESLVSTVVARKNTNTGEGGGFNNNNHGSHTSNHGVQVGLAAATALLAGWATGTMSTRHKKDGDNAKGKGKGDGYPDVNLDTSLTWREDKGLSKLVPLHPIVRSSSSNSNNTTTKNGVNKYTMAQVAKRSTPAEAWIIIDERVYDITHFVAKHPGGDKVLWNMAGKDCTDAFANYHSASIYKKWLPPYLIGECTDVPVYPHVQDFRAVRQELLRRGLFETSSAYYVKLYIWYATLFVTALYLSLRCESTVAHMTGALTMGFFWQQLAGWGHDLGHSSVTHDCKYDNWIGSTIGCSLMGISTGWWKHSHNTHHVVCNSIEHDPDIQHMPVMAVSSEILEQPFWSSYHSKVIFVDPAARFFIRHQHWLFIPIMMVARFNLYAQSWILLLTTTNEKSIVLYNRSLEKLCLVFYATWVLAVAWSMPTVAEKAGWMLLSHAVTALLHVQICVSHFCMETYHGSAYNDASDEWYTMQLKTTMNVDCPQSLDWFHIGLQYQIEHHLYPTLPRHNFPVAKQMVQQVCRKHGIPYHEHTFYEGVRRTIMALRETALQARSGKYDTIDASHCASEIIRVSCIG
jgi:fatty acid desaturase